MANIWSTVLLLGCIVSIANAKLYATLNGSNGVLENSTALELSEGETFQYYLQIEEQYLENVILKPREPSLLLTTLVDTFSLHNDHTVKFNITALDDDVPRMSPYRAHVDIYAGGNSEHELVITGTIVVWIRDNDHAAYVYHGSLSWWRQEKIVQTIHICIMLSLDLSSLVPGANKGTVVDMPVNLNFGDDTDVQESLQMKVLNISENEQYVVLITIIEHEYTFRTSKDFFHVDLVVCCKHHTLHNAEGSMLLSTTVDVLSDGSPQPPIIPMLHIYQQDSTHPAYVRGWSPQGHPLVYSIGEYSHLGSTDRPSLPADCVTVDKVTGQISLLIAQIAPGPWNLPLLIKDAVTEVQISMETVLVIGDLDKNMPPYIVEPKSHNCWQDTKYACVDDEFVLDIVARDTDVFDTMNIVVLSTIPDNEMSISRGDIHDKKGYIEVTWTLTWKPVTAVYYPVCFTALDSKDSYSNPHCLVLQALRKCHNMKAPVIDLNGMAANGHDHMVVFIAEKDSAVPIIHSDTHIEAEDIKSITLQLVGLKDQKREILAPIAECHTDRRLRYYHSDDFTSIVISGDSQGTSYVQFLSCLRYIHTLECPTVGDRDIIISVRDVNQMTSTSITVIKIQQLDKSAVAGYNVIATTGQTAGITQEHVLKLLPDGLDILNMTLGFSPRAIAGGSLQIGNDLDELSNVSVVLITHNKILISGKASSETYRRIAEDVLYTNKENRDQCVSFELHTFDGSVYQDKICGIDLTNSHPRERRDTSNVIVYFTEEGGPISIPTNLGIFDGYMSAPAFVTISLIPYLDIYKESLSVQSVQKQETFNVDGRQIDALVTYTPVVDFTDGVLNVSGLQTVNEYEDVLQTLVYDNIDDEPSDETRWVMIMPHDENSYTVPRNVSIVINLVNDSPTFNDNPRTTPSTYEDATRASQFPVTTWHLAASIVNDSDVDAISGIAIIGVDNDHGSWEYLAYPSHWKEIELSVNTNPDGSVPRNTTLEHLSLVLALEFSNFVQFIPHPNWHGTTHITFVAWDKTGVTASLNDGDLTNATSLSNHDPFSEDAVTIAFVVQPVNDNPTVNASTIIALTTIKEDQDSGDGDSIAKLLSNCHDVDVIGEEHLGVAITYSDISNGMWQYTIDNGTVWNNITAVYSYMALVLGEDGNTDIYRIRFLPNEDWSGTAFIQYKPWDFTDGLTAGTLNVDTTSIDPVVGAYSLIEGKAVITVEPENDSPSLSSGSNFSPMQEDIITSTGTLVIQLIWSSWSDKDGDGQGIAVVHTDNRHGVWQYGFSYPVTWYDFIPIPTLHYATLLSSNAKLRFLPDENFNTVYDNDGNARPPDDVPYITILAWDQTGDTSLQNGVDVSDHAADSTSPFSSGTYNVTQQITAINDRPVLKLTDPDTSSYETTLLENEYEVAIVSENVTLYDVDSPFLQLLKVTISYNFDSNSENSEEMDCEGTSSSDDAIEQILYSLTDLQIDATVQSWCPYEIEFQAIGPTIPISQFNTLLRTLKYSNTKAEPHPADRTISFSVKDTYTMSLTEETTVHVQFQNDAPKLRLNLLGNDTLYMTYMEGVGSMNIIPELILTDSDSTVIMDAIAELAEVFDDGFEILQVHTENTNIMATYVDGRLTLTGADSIQNYEIVLRSLVYENSHQNLSESERTIQIMVHDGDMNSLPVFCLLSVIAVNNPPVFLQNSIQLTPIKEDSTDPPPIAVTDLLYYARDVDNVDLGIAIINSNDGESGTWQFETNGVWTDMHVTDISNTLLLNSEQVIKFQPNNDFNGASYLEYLAWDLSDGHLSGSINLDLTQRDMVTGAFSVDNATAIIMVEAVNDSPVMMSEGYFNTIYEDIPTEQNNGTEVSKLLENTCTDIDGDIVGVAVIGVDNRYGIWQWTCSSSMDREWHDLIGDIMYGKIVPETPIPEKATLLSADCSIRFQPQDDFNSEGNTEIDLGAKHAMPYVTLLAWDNTGDTNGKSGCHGQDTTHNTENDINEFSSDAYNFSILVEATNDPPSLKLGNSDAGNFKTHFIEDGDRVHIVDVTFVNIVDVDDIFMKNMTIRINNVIDGAGEILELQSSNIVSMSGSQVRIKLTLNGSATIVKLLQYYNSHSDNSTIGRTSLTFIPSDQSEQIHSEAFIELLKHVMYSNHVDEPNNTTRMITIDISDGQESGHATTLMEFVIVSDHNPEITMPTAELFFTEGDSELYIFPDIQLADADDNTYYHIQEAVVTIYPLFSGTLVDEWLTAVDFNSELTLDYNSTTGLLTISTLSSIENYEAILRSVVYVNQNPEPLLIDRQVTVKITDDAGLESNIEAVTIRILVINDNKPIVYAGDLFHFIEDTDTSVEVSSGLRLIDADSGDLPISYVNISIPTAYDEFDEYLEVDLCNNITKQYLPAIHTLQLTGPATIVQFHAVLESLTYINIAEEPTPGIHTIQVIANDGIYTSSPAYIEVEVEAVNDSPILDLDILSEGRNISMTYIENAGAVLILQNYSLSLTDNDNKNLSFAEISLHHPGSGYFEIIITDTSDTNVEVSQPISSTHITLTGEDTIDNYRKILLRMTYENVNNNPVTDNQLIEITVSDGLLASSAFVHLHITAVNDPPVVELNDYVNEVVFIEEGNEVLISPNITIEDYDDSTIINASIQIRNCLDCPLEKIIVDNGLISHFGLTVSYNTTFGTMSIIGQGLTSTYQTVLRSIAYINHADEPNFETRLVEFIVNDNSDASIPAYASAIIAMINDPPTLQVNNLSSEFHTSFIEHGHPVGIVADSTQISDVDDTMIAKLSAEILNIKDLGYETLFFDLDDLPASIIQSALSVTELAELNSHDGLMNSTRSFSVTQEFTLHEWTEIMKTLRYCNTYNNATGGKRTIEMYITDPSGASSNICHSYIDVIPVNDPPVLTKPFTYEYVIKEDQNLTIPVLANFEDAEEILDNDSIVILSDPDYGSVLTIKGNIEYFPDFNDYGNYTLSFHICDSLFACSEPVVINITIQSVNDPPYIIEPLEINVDEDSSVNINLRDFVGDYEDDLIPHNPFPAVTFLAGPNTGKKNVSSDNQHVYFTPHTNINGQDLIIVSFCDSDNACIEYVEITINVKSVNDLPGVTVVYPDQSEFFIPNEDTPLQIEIILEDLEDRTPGVLTIISVNSGTAEHNPNHQSESIEYDTVYKLTTHIDYMPFKDFYGIDEILFEVCDNDNGCINTTIDIDVQPVNDPPLISVTTLYMDEDDILTINMPHDLNITDVDNTLDYTNVELMKDVNIGDLHGHNTSIWVYHPPDNFYSDQYTADIVFTVKACDTDLLDQQCTNGNITIIVIPVNDPPITPVIAIEVDEDGSKMFNLGEYICDIEDGMVRTDRISIIEPTPQLVSVSYDTYTGEITVSANTNVYGFEQVHYQACDLDNICSDNGLINIDVININDPPVADDFVYEAKQNELQLISLFDKIHDTELTEAEKIILLDVSLIDPQSGQYVGNIVTENGGTVKVLKHHALLTYEPRIDYIGIDYFNYSVCDECDERLGVVGVTDISCVKQREQSSGLSKNKNGKSIACDHGFITVYVLNSNEAPVVSEMSAITIQPESVLIQPFQEPLSGLTTDSMNIYDPDDIQAAGILNQGMDLEQYNLIDISDINITSLSVVTQPTMGSAETVFSDDELPGLLYTPFSGQKGYDSFIFQVCDKSTEWKIGTCTWATARVHVTTPGPNITAIIAEPAKEELGDLILHTDCKFSRWDTISVIFDRDTSMPPHGKEDTELSANDLNTLFEFADPFITENMNSNPYIGVWKTPNILQITIVDEGYPQPAVDIGTWFLKIKNIEPCGGFDELSHEPLPVEEWSVFCMTDAGYNSAHSTSTSPLLEGSWGYHIPTVKDIIIRNRDVPVQKLRENSNYFGEKSELVLSLWPPLSYLQFVELCKLQADEIIDFTVFGEGTELTKASCENRVPEEVAQTSETSSTVYRGTFLRSVNKRSLDLLSSSDPKGTKFESWIRDKRSSSFDGNSSTIMPVFTELVFEVTKMSNALINPEVDRDTFIKTVTSSIKLVTIANIVSVTTGMSGLEALNYTTDMIIPLEKAELYQEYIIGEIPQVISVTASDPDNLDMNYSDGDVISIVFDKDTDMPAVTERADLDKIFMFDPSLGTDYSGMWKSSQDLEITIIDSYHNSRDSRDIQNISITFTHNILYSGQEFTGQYLYLPTTRPNCVGVNVCGGNTTALTIGICSEDGLSCRATGTYFITDGNFGTGIANSSLWWIIPIIIGCAIVLFILIIIAICCCKYKKKAFELQHGSFDTSKLKRSSSTRTSWKVNAKTQKIGRTAPGILPQMMLFNSQAHSKKLVDDVSKAQYGKKQVNVDYSTVQSNKSDDSTDPTVSAMFPDLRAALLLQRHTKHSSIGESEPNIHPHSPTRSNPTAQQPPLLRHNSEIDMSIPSKHEDTIPQYTQEWQKLSGVIPPPPSPPPPDWDDSSQSSPNRNNTKLSTLRTDPVQEALLIGHRNSLQNASNAMSQKLSQMGNQPSSVQGTIPLRYISSNIPEASATSSNSSLSDVGYRTFLQNHFPKRKISPSVEDLSIQRPGKESPTEAFGEESEIEILAKQRKSTIKRRSDTSIYNKDGYELKTLRGDSHVPAMYNSENSLHDLLARRQSTNKDSSRL
ncbi:uncharacterized protein LOC100369441 [Saccoglossus kowalevskii]|uniref:Uncharacterized protein LOC100369441 n=1 Tax=Saccoglossus kowalevskii TaxID=10224 RepID=A0ABM0H0N7_SACKO|nr:PREDICTED: uncharacterized protein LOC100369441 [Saccoglossus kowalevskii]